MYVLYKQIIRVFGLMQLQRIRKLIVPENNVILLSIRLENIYAL